MIDNGERTETEKWEPRPTVKELKATWGECSGRQPMARQTRNHSSARH